MAEHVFTEGEKRCLEEYWRECSKTPRKNLIKLVSHINMFNPLPNEKSWEYIFYDRQLTDEQLVAAGIDAGMVRFSVGLENIDDILDDLKQAFAQV